MFLVLFVPSLSPSPCSSISAHTDLLLYILYKQPNLLAIFFSLKNIDTNLLTENDLWMGFAESGIEFMESNHQHPF